MSRNTKSSKEVENNNRKSRFYLEALAETCPARLPLLPTSFSPSDKSPHITVREPAYIRAEYKGPGDNDSDSAQIRSNHAIPVECGLFYFEVRIISKGKDGFMGIGVSTKDVRTNKLPGWERGSYGYHGDDGKKFRGSGAGETYGPIFTTGDVIGCIVNFLDNSISYTKNGIFLGHAFTDFKERELYPIVGMRSEGECMELNCGAEQFCFDLQSYVQEERSQIQHLIRETPVSGIDDMACQCIISYLVQQGYPESALALAKSCGKEYEIQAIVDSIRQRRKILDAVLHGDIPKVFELLKDACPQLLEMRQDIWFMLKCQHFIELVKSGEEMSAVLEYGSELHSIFDSEEGPGDEEDAKMYMDGKEEEEDTQMETDAKGQVIDLDVVDIEDRIHSEGAQVDDHAYEAEDMFEAEEEEEDRLDEDHAHGPRADGRQAAEYHGGYPTDETEHPMPQYREIPRHHRHELLEKVFSLVAYVEPAISPNSYLLDQTMRIALADRINIAMQATDRRPSKPTLERLSRQARVMIDMLEDLSVVGLLMKNEVPLGYGDTHERSAESHALNFFNTISLPPSI
mmetsp:Transcript_46829/g.83979  ORF Transcript_46829/g.83979 Transcript_46829/m.83979 type:complete len:572 (-) Transcript_46829:1018-2733(-)